MVKVSVNVDGTPATTGVGTDIATTPSNPIALSAIAADVALTEFRSTPSVVANTASGVPRQRPWMSHGEDIISPRCRSEDRITRTSR
jgi:hypothetical protein